MPTPSTPNEDPKPQPPIAAVRTLGQNKRPTVKQPSAQEIVDRVSRQNAATVVDARFAKRPPTPLEIDKTNLAFQRAKVGASRGTYRVVFELHESGNRTPKRNLPNIFLTEEEARNLADLKSWLIKREATYQQLSTGRDARGLVTRTVRESPVQTETNAIHWLLQTVNMQRIDIETPVVVVPAAPPVALVPAPTPAPVVDPAPRSPRRR